MIRRPARLSGRRRRCVSWVLYCSIPWPFVGLTRKRPSACRRVTGREIVSLKAEGGGDRIIPDDSDGPAPSTHHPPCTGVAPCCGSRECVDAHLAPLLSHASVLDWPCRRCAGGQRFL